MGPERFVIPRVTLPVGIKVRHHIRLACVEKDLADVASLTRSIAVLFPCPVTAEVSAVAAVRYKSMET